MEDAIAQHRQTREICEDFLTANPNIQVVATPGLIVSRDGDVTTQQGNLMSNLHNQIMSLPCDTSKLPTGQGHDTAYKLGHRDCRHVAAELALVEAYRVAGQIKELEATNRLLQEQLRYAMRDQAVKDAKIKMLEEVQDTPVGIYRYEPATLTYGVQWLIKGTLEDNTKLYTRSSGIPDGWTRSEDGKLHPPAGFVADVMAALNDTPGS